MAALGGGKESRQGGASPSGQVASRQQIEIENERRSLNEALRLLATDRDRLMTRVGSIERNLDDITGSIKSQPTATVRTTPPVSVKEPSSKLDAPPVIAADPPRTKPAGLPNWLANAPEPWPSPSSATAFAPGPPFPDIYATPVRVTAIAPKPAEAPAAVPVPTEFGIDIGGGADIAETRLLWSAAKQRHGKLLAGMRPLVVRKQDSAGNPDYRLVIGPVANAGGAAKLCSAFSSPNAACSPKPYQGERLTP
jgi:hypothetical protein